MAIQWQITQQENDPWSLVWDASINPTKPDYFQVEKLTDGLLICCGGQKYAGQLAKNTAPLLHPSTNIRSTYELKFYGDLLQHGQVIELDRKFTDAGGWTYDGSFQINVSLGMVPQYGNPWQTLGSALNLAPGQWNSLEVEYVLDYVNHTITVAVNGGPASPPVAAKNNGWTPGQIVTQLQLCTNGLGGFYSCQFSGIGLSGF